MNKKFEALVIAYKNNVIKCVMTDHKSDVNVSCTELHAHVVKQLLSRKWLYQTAQVVSLLSVSPNSLLIGHRL